MDQMEVMSLRSHTLKKRDKANDSSYFNRNDKHELNSQQESAAGRRKRVNKLDKTSVSKSQVETVPITYQPTRGPKRDGQLNEQDILDQDDDEVKRKILR